LNTEAFSPILLPSELLDFSPQCSRVVTSLLSRYHPSPSCSETDCYRVPADGRERTIASEHPFASCPPLPGGTETSWCSRRCFSERSVSLFIDLDLCVIFITCVSGLFPSKPRRLLQSLARTRCETTSDYCDFKNSLLLETGSLLSSRACVLPPAGCKPPLPASFRVLLLPWYLGLMSFPSSAGALVSPLLTL